MYNTVLEAGHDKPVESLYERHSPVREVIGTDARPQGWLVQRAWLETDDVNAHRSHKNREGSEICSWVTRKRPHLNAAARESDKHIKQSVCFRTTYQGP